MPCFWVAWFWAGFGLGLVPGTRLAKRPPGRAPPLASAAAALVVGCVALTIGVAGDRLPLLVVGLAVTGSAWGVFTTIAFASAVALSDGRASAGGIGIASGLLFCALALGTLLRLGFTAGGGARTRFATWLPQGAWLIASALIAVLLATLWRSGPADSTTPTESRR